MFPCFDEPAMKAMFTVQVNAPPGYHAISNTEWQKIEKTYEFENTSVIILISHFSSKFLFFSIFSA